MMVRFMTDATEIPRSLQSEEIESEYAAHASDWNERSGIFMLAMKRGSGSGFK